jgi:hypothetical protein
MASQGAPRRWPVHSADEAGRRNRRDRCHLVGSGLATRIHPSALSLRGWGVQPTVLLPPGLGELVRCPGGPIWHRHSGRDRLPAAQIAASTENGHFPNIGSDDLNVVSLLSETLAQEHGEDVAAADILNTIDHAIDELSSDHDDDDA